MSEKLYNVVFRGVLRPGENPKLVKKRMAAVLQIDSKQINAIFATASVDIKTNLSRDDAQRYRIALSERIGIECYLEPSQSFSLELTPTDENTDDDESEDKNTETEFECPACGHIEIVTSDHNGACVVCGVVAEKYSEKLVQDSEREKIKKRLLAQKSAEEQRQFDESERQEQRKREEQISKELKKQYGIKDGIDATGLLVKYKTHIVAGLISIAAIVGILTNIDWKDDKPSDVADALQNESNQQPKAQVIQGNSTQNTLDIAKGMDDIEQQDKAMTIATKQAAQQGNYKKAAQIANSINDHVEGAEAIGMIAQQLNESGKSGKAIELLNRTSTKAKDINETVERGKVFSVVAKHQYKLDDTTNGKQNFANAMRETQQTKTAEDRIELLSAIAVDQAQADVGDSEDTLELALETTEQINDTYSKIRALNLIAKRQSDAGDKDGARKLFASTIETIKAISNPELRDKSLLDVVRKQAFAGHINGALQTVKIINDINLQSKALMDIAKQQSLNKRFKAAMLTITKIKNREYQIEAYSAIGKYQLLSGLKYSSQQAFGAAIDLANSIEDIQERIKANSLIARQWAKGGNNDDANNIFNEALDSIQSISNPSNRDQAYAIIADNQAQAGMFVNSAKTAKQIQNSKISTEISKKIYELEQESMVFMALEDNGTINPKSTNTNTNTIDDNFDF